MSDTDTANSINTTEDIPCIADFANNHTILEGKKVKISDIVNIPLVFTGWKISASHFKDKNSRSMKCLTLQFDKDGDKCIIFTSSSVLIQQITDFEKQSPNSKKFKATIRHIDNRFYKFSN